MPAKGGGYTTIDSKDDADQRHGQRRSGIARSAQGKAKYHLSQHRRRKEDGPKYKFDSEAITLLRQAKDTNQLFTKGNCDPAQ